MSDPVCKCGHPRSRHFKSSTLKGHHACLVVVGRTPCECRCYEDEHVRGSVVKQPPARPKLTPAQQRQRDKDLL